MRANAVFAVVVIAIASSLALAGCNKHVSVLQPDPNGPVEVVIPGHGAYTGAFMDFGDEEDDVTLEMIEDFETMVGKHQAIIASSSYWGEQSFPTDNLNVIGDTVRCRSFSGRPGTNPMKKIAGSRASLI